MDRARLLAEMTAAGPGPQGAVLVERRGDDYRWARLRPGQAPDLSCGQRPDPDAWIFYTGPWPAQHPADLPAFLEDLLAEMESVCGGADRCRWPLDQPYPVRH